MTSRKDQEQYWHDKSTPYEYVSVTRFAEEFQNFHVGIKMREELAVPFPKEKSHPAALAQKKYTISNGELFKASFAREVTLAKRHAVVYIVKAVQVCVCLSLSHTHPPPPSMPNILPGINPTHLFVLKHHITMYDTI